MNTIVVNFLYDAHLLMRKAKAFPLWLRRKMGAGASANLQQALNMTVDITKAPTARGKLRCLQKIDLLLLQVFHDFCERHGFHYYMAYGTLLGAVRHGGFIPWDDDVDLMVFSEEFEKLLSSLEEEIKGSGFIMFGIDGARFDDITIRLSLRDFPLANIDLFLTFPSNKQFAQLDAQRGLLQDKADRQMRISQKLAWGSANRENNAAYWSNFVRSISKLVDASAMDCASSYYGIGCWDSNCYRKNEMWPLKRIEFEGREFWAPNDPVAYLNETIRDWMSFPPRFDHHGDQFLSFTEQDADRAIGQLQRCVDLHKFL